MAAFDGLPEKAEALRALSAAADAATFASPLVTESLLRARTPRVGTVTSERFVFRATGGTGCDA
jgi:hypothetical protein